MTTARHQAIPGLDARAHRRHALHEEARIWVEKNCYVDVWIELLHALDLEPLAMLPFVAAIDFEGDQWTFFKPPHDELRDLYGIDVQELNVWRPLIEHARESLAAGRLISTEADAFWLPDTAGTDYRRQHTKSTIILADLDEENRRLGYFHNAGYFSLEREDFARTFGLDRPPAPDFMPLYAESVRWDRIRRQSPPQLVSASVNLWKRHLARLPLTNPVERFRAHFQTQQEQLMERGLAHYHAWAFATIRQLGAASELAAANLAWLEQGGVTGLADAATSFDAIARASKTLILKAARAVNARRPLDLSVFDSMAGDWQSGTDTLRTRLGGAA